MSIRSIALAAAAAFALSATASAESVKALQARSIDLGTLSGVTYYTAQPDGYRVVVTLARRESAPAVRFEATLAPGQSTVVSIPQELGAQAQAIKISRVGDEVVVRKAVRETASAE